MESKGNKEQSNKTQGEITTFDKIGDIKFPLGKGFYCVLDNSDLSKSMLFYCADECDTINEVMQLGQSSLEDAAIISNILSRLEALEEPGV